MFLELFWYKHHKNLQWFTKTVITEKDIIAIKNKTQLFEFGDEALKMYEKTPPNINIIFPIKYGVIADLKNMSFCLKAFIRR